MYIGAIIKEKAIDWLTTTTYPRLTNLKKEGFLIWHHGRCGSTVLGNMLRQHPQVRMYGERFERYARMQRQRPNFAADLKWLQMLSGQHLTGFEIKGLPCQQLPHLEVGLDGFLQTIRELGFERGVFLDRRNTLRKIVSVQIVDQGIRKSYNSRKSSPLKGKVVIDLNRVRILGKYASLLEMLDYINSETEAARQIMKEHYDFLPLFYEDHIQEDPNNAYKAVQEHLFLSPYDAQVKLKRVNTKSLKEIIGNFDEVADLLSGTEYAWMLES
ncbi:MAG: hypothetical protein AAF974_06415 [Cyanobacteria bacterium P01_E01_bin.34]